LQADHWYLIVGLGITGSLGQYFITEAFRLAAPPVVAPLEYTALAWGMLFDWLLWATAPGLRMLTGAFIIVASGIYVINRERAASAALQQQH
jgi:drug/metabolite transporter (DMT)-like permease